MPKKKYDLPKGLQNKPPGSENWYQLFYRKDRSPKIKWVRLDAHDLAGAKMERDRLLRSYELGLFDPWARKEAKAARTDVVLAEAVREYLDAQSGLAPSTRASKRSHLNRFVRSVGGGHRRLRQLGEGEVEHFAERPDLKETTRHKRVVELSAFFSWCMAEGHCEANPAREYNKRRSRGLSAYAKRMRGGDARQALMPDDLQKLLDKIQSRGKHLFLYDVVLFALATGVRRSELAHLNHRDVDLDVPPQGYDYTVTGRIRVRCWSNSTTGERFVTKNGKDRVVPLCPLAARIASRHLAADPTGDPWQPLFRAPKGGRLIPGRLSEWFHLYRTKCGFSDRITFHSLRHSFASWLMMLGVNPFSIKRLLGHSSLDQLDTYAELCEEYLMGDARGVQRAMLDILCVDLPEGLIDRVLPRRRSLLAALSDRRGGRVQALHSIIPMEDVLFSGVAYESAAAEEVDATEPTFEAAEGRFELLETF